MRNSSGMVDTTKQNCPYRTLPRTAYWRNSVAQVAPSDLDPVTTPRFTFTSDTKIATAGSCFAQHIARYLQTVGSNYFVTEPGHPKLPSSIRLDYNYGTFTARFGNIYTSSQLVQLFDRAYGRFNPAEQPWGSGDGLIDPFRPAIQPGGFATQAEFDRDREAHFAAVRHMFESLDVFVFTLGLTEGWRTKEDGAMLPVCPGCGAGGTFDPDRYEFVNEKVSDVVENLDGLIVRLKAVNPDAKILLTVSPVPLIATYSGKHVLSATSYSKSVLRAAAGEIYDRHSHVDYFPSYEIITGAYNRGAYFGEDLRSVEEAGVRHVMKQMFKHYLNLELMPEKEVPRTSPQQAHPPASIGGPGAASASSHVARVVCDEELLDP